MYLIQAICETQFPFSLVDKAKKSHQENFFYKEVIFSIDIHILYIYIECIYIFSTVVCVYTLLFSIFLREGLVQVQLVMPVQLLL